MNRPLALGLSILLGVVIHVGLPALCAWSALSTLLAVIRPGRRGSATELEP